MIFFCRMTGTKSYLQKIGLSERPVHPRCNDTSKILYIYLLTLFDQRTLEFYQKILSMSLIYLLLYIAFNSHGHIAMGSLQVEAPVHTTWSRFCTVNHRALASNYQLSNIKHLGRDSTSRPHRLKASTLTPTPPSPLDIEKMQCRIKLNVFNIIHHSILTSK